MTVASPARLTRTACAAAGLALVLGLAGCDTGRSQGPRGPLELATATSVTYGPTEALVTVRISRYRRNTGAGADRETVETTVRVPYNTDFDKVVGGQIIERLHLDDSDQELSGTRALTRVGVRGRISDVQGTWASRVEAYQWQGTQTDYDRVYDTAPPKGPWTEVERDVKSPAP